MLGSVLSSVFAGGATGLLGVGFKLYGDYKNKQLDLQREQQAQEFELRKREADAKLLEKEWEGRARVATAEGEAQASVAASNAFAASYKFDNERYTDARMLDKLHPWVRWLCVLMLFALDWIRGATRPGLAIYLAILTTMVFFEARSILDGNIVKPEVAQQLVLMIVQTILYLFVTCVTWYYGVRNLQQPPKL